MALREDVQERYPALVPLLRIPELSRLFTRAVRQNWSPNMFQSQFMATRWFRKRSEAQRRWYVLAATDPGEARRQRREFSAELIKAASGLGVKLDAHQVWRYTNAGLSQGIAPDSARGMANLLAFGLKRGMGPGAYKTAVGAVRAIGADEWMRMPGRKEAEYWAAEISLGRKTLDDFRAANAVAASKRYPHMVAQIQAGRTVADIVRPGVEAYAKEMDWDPDGLMAKIHTDPQHTGLLGIRDPKTGKVRVPSEYEAGMMARSRNDWWGTTHGRQSDASMALSLLQAFGRRA